MTGRGLLVLTLLAAGCTTAVEAARDREPTASDSPSPIAAIPADLSIDPDRQTCRRDSDCHVLTGLPGSSLPEICCASCQLPTALNEANATLARTWRDSARCGDVICSPPGPCTDERRQISAVCHEGLCQLR